MPKPIYVRSWTNEDRIMCLLLQAMILTNWCNHNHQKTSNCTQSKKSTKTSPKHDLRFRYLIFTLKVRFSGRYNGARIANLLVRTSSFFRKYRVSDWERLRSWKYYMPHSEWLHFCTVFCYQILKLVTKR